MNPLISIIIPTYNHARFVVFAVESALAQTYADREVIVVDDGSTDNTREVLSSYTDRIRYIHQENRGLSAARNAGIRAAQGAFIAILDADDVWLPGKLDAQMRVFRQYPETGAVSCIGEVVDDRSRGQRAEGRGRDLSSATGALSRICKVGELLCGNQFSGGSYGVVRRECFDKVGLFDEELRSSEDWDMWLRIGCRWPLRIVTQVLASVRVSGDSMSAAKNADRMLANDLRVLDKLFADPETKVNAYDRGVAYAYRYVAAAWAHHQVGNQVKAREYILKAFLANPMGFVLRRGFCGLAVRIALGKGSGDRVRMKDER